MFDHIPPDLRQAGPGVAGSLLALLFMRRPWTMLLAMFVGGCLIAYIVTPWLAAYLEVGPKGEGVVGFLLGLFGMATTAKVFDLIEAINVADIWAALKDWIRKRLGVEGKTP